MKKILLSLAIGLFLASCGQDSEEFDMNNQYLSGNCGSRVVDSYNSGVFKQCVQEQESVGIDALVSEVENNPNISNSRLDEIENIIEDYFQGCSDSVSNFLAMYPNINCNIVGGDLSQSDLLDTQKIADDFLDQF